MKSRKTDLPVSGVFFSGLLFLFFIIRFHAATQYGRLGVKVWICRGEIRPELAKKNNEKGE